MPGDVWFKVISVVVGGSLIFSSAAFAQSRIEPDDTLGNERSTVIQNFRGSSDDVIEGGARRGRNLFHSFREFNVDQGRGAYFFAPDAGVRNIFSRVTGRNPSQILGTLGTRRFENNQIFSSDANLFLINPNGILFGPNSSLDLGGSFVGTTANAIQFGNLGFFDATNPGAPSALLTIDPSAFLFSQTGGGSIVSRAIELDSAPGSSLLFLGGNVSLDNSILFSSGGRIEIGGLAGVGTVQLAPNGDTLQLKFSAGISRADVSLQNNSFIFASAPASVGINAQNLGLSNSTISSVVLGGQNEQSGDIVIDVAGTLSLDRGYIGQIGLESSSGNTGNVLINARSAQLSNQSGISNSSRRDAGYIRLSVSDGLALNNSQINAVSFPGAIGNGSDIFVDARSIDLVNQSIIGSTSASEGAAGGVTLAARDAITLSDSAIQSNVNPLISGTTSRASSGDLDIQARLLSLREGSRISASSVGAGRSGNIYIDTRDAITLDNGFIESNAIATTEAGGDIELQTGQLSLSNYSQVNAYTMDYFKTGELGQGDAGNITIDAQRLSLSNASGIYTSSIRSRGNAGDITIRAKDVEVTGFLNPDELARLELPLDQTSDGVLVSEINSGVTNNNFNDIEVQGGTITIEADRLRLTDGGSIATDVQQARGRAGNIIVYATHSIEISGRARFNLPSGLSSNLQADGIGRGGSIQVRTGQLNMSNAGQIAAATTSQGNAGTVSIEASEINLLGSSTRITTQVDEEARGNGGDLNIQAQRLQVQDNAEISTNTFGVGNAGNLTVNASEIELTDTPDPQDAATGLLTVVARGATGNAGNLIINTDRLTINNGAGVFSSTLGRGQAGDVEIRASEQISLNRGEVASSVAAEAVGNGGRVIITTPNLYLRNNSNITTSTSGNGNAGSMAIEAERIDLQNANIDTAVADSGRGNAGNLTIHTQQLRLRDDASINSISQGIGNAGNLTVKADRIDLRSGSDISTQLDSGSQGRGGNLNIQTRQLRVRNNAQISTGTLGTDNAGNLRVRAREIELVDTPDSADSFTGLFTLIDEVGIGNAGDLQINTDRLTIRNGASISSEVFGRGQGGDVQVRARDRINIFGSVPLSTGDFSRSGIFTGTNGQGNAGNILIRSSNGITLRQRGRISSASTAGSRGNAGDVDLQTHRLTVLEGGSVLASVSSARRDAEGVALPGGRGRGGNIQIDAAERILVSGSDRNGLSSVISTSTGRGATGQAGRITLTTNNLEIDQGGVVAARTLNSSSAGRITVNADHLTTTNGGQVVTSTSDRGNAGRIDLNVNEIGLTGADRDFAVRLDRTRRYINRLNRGDRLNDFTFSQGATSGLFANTSTRSSGNGGSINLNTTNLTLADRARISAQSRGTGAAGGVAIEARGNVNLSDRTRISTQSQGRNAAGNINLEVGDTFAATNSDVTTSAANASGGNIRLNASDVRLLGDSDIRTNSARNGGNITLSADTIVAFEDSDLFASAAKGRGGDITLNTPAFFGSNYQPETSETAEVDQLENNSRVDINATGTVSSGAIALPNTSFIQNSLADLPATAIDSNQLLANSCIARTESGGTFLITGSGGLPERPGHSATSTYPTGEVRSIPVQSELHPLQQPRDSIVEPQGVYRLPDGRLVMSRECETQTP